MRRHRELKKLWGEGSWRSSESGSVRFLVLLGLSRSCKVSPLILIRSHPFRPALFLFLVLSLNADVGLRQRILQEDEEFLFIR